jgi:AraC-like DNA-binding protein
MDPLSDACSSLTVKEIESGQLHIGGCWGMRFPAHGCVTFGASLKGPYWLFIDGQDQPILIEEGDCYLIANRVGYCKSSKPDMEASELIEEGDCYLIANRVGYCKSSKPDMEASDLRPPFVRANSVMVWPIDVVNRHPNDCDNTLTGVRVIFEEARSNFLFDLLPPIIHIPGNSDAAPVIRSMLHVLAGENAARKIGATVIANSLAHILLVQALRTYVATEDRPRGWLGALADAKIGAALALMHRHDAQQWTIGNLAAAIGMSRSSFALRFKSVVGQAPLDYWLQWRMHLAGHTLRNSNRTVSSVAFAWGYESEKSFGKAFKRVMGCAPTSYRQADRMRPTNTNHQ